MEIIIQNLIISRDFSASNIRNEFKKLGFLNIDSVIFPTSYDQLINDRKSNLVNGFEESASVIYLNKILSIIELGSTVTEIHDLLDAEKLNIKNNITSTKDLNSLLICAEVFKKSTTFWAPQNLGGDGLGFQFLELINQNQYREVNWSWKGALVGDGLGAGSAMIAGALIIGFTCATGGVGAAFVWGIAASTATDSLWGGLL